MKLNLFKKSTSCHHDMEFICTYYEGFPPIVEGYYKCKICGKTHKK